MTTITPYKAKAQADYDDLTAELMGLPYDCERAKAIRKQQESMERLSPELKKRKIDKMADAARLHLPALMRKRHDHLSSFYRT